MSFLYLLLMYLSLGSGGGVSFQLNIEQYEYMTGPNEGAGVKLLVHNRGDVPLVKDNGLALQPGTLSFVAVKIIEVGDFNVWTHQRDTYVRI